MNLYTGRTVLHVKYIIDDDNDNDVFYFLFSGLEKNLFFPWFIKICVMCQSYMMYIYYLVLLEGLSQIIYLD